MGNRGGCPVLHCLLVFQHLLLFLVLLLLLPTYHSKCQKPPIIFNFGDSNSDTGGLSAGLGYSFGLPHGRVFFRWPTGRLCDGRLIIDFLCESVHARYLSPYLEALGSDFSNGANFAIAGAATQPRNLPFSLFIQLLQFLHFRSRSLGLVSQGSKNLINEEGFSRALYTFDIGQNDLTSAFNANISYEEIIGRIPSILSEIRGAIETIHKYGGKNFWIHNTGPLGCLPEKLSSNRNTSDFDVYGCLISFNNAAKAFNNGLSGLFDELTTELKDATIVYTDVFTIKYDLIVNHAKYGFEKPLVACCGFGGPPYNYNKNVTCGNSACQVCPEGSRYISWDGVHYTEAATSIVAAKILSGNYSKPPNVKFESFCIS